MCGTIPARGWLKGCCAKHTKLPVETGEITSSQRVDINADAAKKDCAQYIERQSNALLLVSILQLVQIYTGTGSAFCWK